MRPINLNATRLVRSLRGGQESLASLIETCKRKAVSTEHWLADILAKL
jgi:hypothetical protein